MHRCTTRGRVAVERSKRRRKARERTVELWRRELLRALAEARAEIGLAADDRMPDALLVDEVLELADPYTYDGLDAVVPAPRLDLAAIWFRARLNGEANTAEERRDLARQIAPAPDFEPSGRFAWGVDRAAIERAIKYVRRRRASND